jgi:hypothetical protein
LLFRVTAISILKKNEIIKTTTIPYSTYCK